MGKQKWSWMIVLIGGDKSHARLSSQGSMYDEVFNGDDPHAL